MRHSKVTIAWKCTKTNKASIECVSTDSETASLSKIWYKSNINNFWICRCGVQISSTISIRFHKSVSVILHLLDGEVVTKPVGWTMCFLLISSGLVRRLGASCVVCDNLLFLHSFNKVNLIFTYYSGVTSWYILNETANVAVNGSLYTFCLCGPCVHFVYFWAPKSWISNCYHNP